IARTSSGSSCSERAVKPTTSTKSTVTILRSSISAGADAGSGAAQALQNRAPAAFSCPQLGQVCIEQGYDYSRVGFRSRRQKTIAASTAASASEPAAIVIRSRVFELPPPPTEADSGCPEAAASLRIAFVAASTCFVASFPGGGSFCTTATPAWSVLPLIE